MADVTLAALASAGFEAFGWAHGSEAPGGARLDAAAERAAAQGARHEAGLTHAEAQVAALRDELRAHRKQDKARRKALAVRQEHEVQHEVERAEGEFAARLAAVREEHGAEVRTLRAQLGAAHRQLRDFEAAVQAGGMELLEQLA